MQQVPSFINSVELKKKCAHGSFLHTELMRDHVFVKNNQGKWSVSGLIDFEPSVVGSPEYDFASVGLFVAMNETHLFKTFLAGYGADLTDKNISKRVMAYTILHRYSNLKWYMSFMPKGNSLEELSSTWFSTK